MIYVILLEDSNEVRQGQGVSGEFASRLGDVFHLDSMVIPHILIFL